MVAVNATYPSLPGTDISFEEWVHLLPCALAPEEKSRLQAAWTLARTGCTGDANPSETSSFGRAQAVAALLAELGLDTDTLAAGLLYQLPRSTGFELAALTAKLGSDVAGLVDGIAKVGAIGGLHAPTDQKSGNQMEASRKMILAMARDMRVVFIALAIRLIDMRNLDTRPASVRSLMARQTLTLYAPLANRLGIARLKWELQDLSLRILEPDSYQQIARLLAARRIDREHDISSLQTQITEALAQAGIHATVSGRPKHIYSIWKKMQQKDLTFDQLFDIRAFRILVDHVPECYAALAIIHELWPPIPEEYSDYIAAPKANDYRSLHTVVQGPGNRPLEVQFRTHQMHEQAELGGAAHWRYKEGGRQDESFDAKVAWLRELLQWAQTEADENNAIGRYKTELFEDRVYVLTPEGDVVDLPRGATPIEFAYRIHTQVGHHCRGAKVNGKMVGLKHQLNTGDQVAILTARNAEPSRDWLHPESGYLVSARARAKVQRWFRSRDYDRHVAEGRITLERELRRLSASKSIKLERLAQHSRFPKLDDFLAAIGRGDIASGQIARLLTQSFPDDKPALQPATPPQHSRDDRDPDTIIVDGVNNLYTRLAGCCQPTTDDAIVGFITRNYGISIHRDDCANIARLDTAARQRLIPAQWSK